MSRKNKAAIRRVEPVQLSGSSCSSQNSPRAGGPSRRLGVTDQEERDLQPRYINPRPFEEEKQEDSSMENNADAEVMRVYTDHQIQTGQLGHPGNHQGSHKMPRDPESPMMRL